MIPTRTSKDTRSDCTARVLCVTRSKHVRNELLRLGASKEQAAKAENLTQSFVLKLHGLQDFEIPVLQTAFEAGGMLFISQKVSANGSSLIVSGSTEKLRSVLSQSNERSLQIESVFRCCQTALTNYLQTGYKVAYPGGELDLDHKTAVMGVVNITPDSFSDGGDFYTAESAIEHAFRLAEAGANILDIGGESTRPGSDPVSVEEETERVLPVIEAVASKLSIPVSVDTYKPDVARAALETGAKIINDVSGLRDNGELAALAAEKEVPVILMHMKGSPKTMQQDPVYNDLISEIYSSLSGSIATAISAGIQSDRIVIDPGIGFGKTVKDNLVILDRLHEFKSLGVPICIGVSRKSFLGATLGIAEPKRRLVGSLAANVIVVREGARIVRVHDVPETVEAVRVADAVAAGRLSSEA